MGSFICSKANSIAVNIVASAGIQTENISLLTLVAISLDSHVTIFRLLHPHGTSETPCDYHVWFTLIHSEDFLNGYYSRTRILSNTEKSRLEAGSRSLFLEKSNRFNSLWIRLSGFTNGGTMEGLIY